jgi:hypothetical protein
MSKQKFTQGKWSYRPTVTKYGYYIETVDQNTFIGKIGGGLQSKSEVEANAALVASAPEMYRDLNSLILSITSHPDYIEGSENDEWHTLVSLAQSTLKKAH